jgi:hypothetical protein
LLKLREECRLRGFKNRVLRRIFGSKRDEITAEWRTVYKRQLHALYSSPHYHSGDQIKKEMGRACSMHGNERSACRVLVGKPDGRRPLERLRHRGQDNIKMDQEVR